MTPESPLTDLLSKQVSNKNQTYFCTFKRFRAVLHIFFLKKCAFISLSRFPTSPGRLIGRDPCTVLACPSGGQFFCHFFFAFGGYTPHYTAFFQKQITVSACVHNPPGFLFTLQTLVVMVTTKTMPVITIIFQNCAAGSCNPPK